MGAAWMAVRLVATVVAGGLMCAAVALLVMIGVQMIVVGGLLYGVLGFVSLVAFLLGVTAWLVWRA